MALHIIAIFIPALALMWYARYLITQHKKMMLVEQTAYFALIFIYFHIRHYLRTEGYYPMPYLNAIHTLMCLPCVPLGHYFACRMFGIPAPNRATWGMLACGLLSVPSIIYNIVCPGTSYSPHDNGMNMITVSFSNDLTCSIGLNAVVYILQGCWVVERINKVRKRFAQQQLHLSQKVRILLWMMLGIILLVITGNLLPNNSCNDALLADILLVAYTLIISGWIVMLSLINKDKILLDANNNPGRIENDPIRALTIGIRYLMDEKKVFVQQGLKLEDLAHTLGTNRTYLSTAIHKTYDCSFPELLMQQRLAEAKRLLREQPNLLISEVAEQSGFSSSSVFGKAFRESTGMTAKEYRSQQKK